MADTFANQKTIYIHKEKCTKDFLQVQNDHWRYAGKILKYGTFKLYLELAGNNDGFKYRISKAGSETNLGISKNVYYRAVEELIEKGYLVEANGNMYDFYTVPYKGQNQNNISPVEGTPNENSPLQGTHSCPVEGNFNSPVEGTIPLEGTPCPVEGTKESLRRDNLSRVRVENIDSSRLIDSSILDGHPSDSLDGNFVSSERHPSGSLEHPTDAASLEAKPEQKKKAKQKKKKDRVREPNELSIEEKEEITKLYYEIPYQEIYERMNLRYNSLQYEDIERFKKEVAEYKKNMEKNILVSQLENQPDKLEKIAKYSECSVDEAKENIVKFKLDPDMLIDCFDGDDGGIYKRDYWLKESSNYTHWEWIAGCYNLQYNSSLNGNRVTSNRFNSSVKTENSSVLDKDIDDMTDDDIVALIDSW